MLVDLSFPPKEVSNLRTQRPSAAVKNDDARLWFGGQPAAIIPPSADLAVAEACYVIGDGSEAILIAEPYVTTGIKWGPSATFGTTGGTVTWSIAGAGWSNGMARITATCSPSRTRR